MSPIAVNVIETSTPEVFNYLMYPQQDSNTMAYIQNQFQNISQTLTDSGRKFMEESKRLYEKFYDNTVERAARAAVRMARNLVHPNSIQRYDSIEDIQSASPLMQRYIMAEPYIREKFHDQLCSGYAGSYLNVEPGFLNLDHYDWRRINNGLVRTEGDDEDGRWVSTTHFEDLIEGDRELSWEDKVDILHTNELAVLYAKTGIDPTCPFGSKLG